MSQPPQNMEIYKIQFHKEDTKLSPFSSSTHSGKFPPPSLDCVTSGAQIEKDEPFHKFYADLSLKINFLTTGRGFSFSSASRPASILGHVPRPDYEALLCGHGSVVVLVILDVSLNGDEFE